MLPFLTLQRALCSQTLWLPMPPLALEHQLVKAGLVMMVLQQPLARRKSTAATLDLRYLLLRLKRLGG